MHWPAVVRPLKSEETRYLLSRRQPFFPYELYLRPFSGLLFGKLWVVIGVSFLQSFLSPSLFQRLVDTLQERALIQLRTWV